MPERDVTNPLSGPRAVRLLRAKAAELESVVGTGDFAPFEMFAADIALVATLLADEIERRSDGK